MADNTTLNAGSGGDTYASDDIAGVKYQRVKLVEGADGVNDGDVSAANPLPVSEANSAAIQAAVEAIDAGKLEEATFTDRIGEVQASPTANTLLERTKAINTSVLAVLAELLNKADLSETQPVSAASLPLPSGASTSANQTTANADLASIKTAVEILDNIVAGSEAQVDIVTSALPAGASTSAAQTTAQTALDAINTATTALAVALSAAGTEVDVNVLSHPLRNASVDTITAKLATDTLQNGTTALTPKFARINGNTSGDNTLVAAVASKKIRVHSMVMVAAGDVTVNIEDGASSGTYLCGPISLPADGNGFILQFNPIGWFQTTANTILNMELSAGIVVGGCLAYTEV